MDDSDDKLAAIAPANTSKEETDDGDVAAIISEVANPGALVVEPIEAIDADAVEIAPAQDSSSLAEEDAVNGTEVTDSIVNQEPEKRFEEWIQLKEKLHYGCKSPRIRQGEIWWCSFGENIGVEINGKSTRFTRPVLIMKKLSHLGFMGIPLTSQPKTGSWYASFDFLGKTEYAAVCQARVMSVSRLHSKMGELPMSDLITVKEVFHRLYR